MPVPCGPPCCPPVIVPTSILYLVGQSLVNWCGETNPADPPTDIAHLKKYLKVAFNTEDHEYNPRGCHFTYTPHAGSVPPADPAYSIPWMQSDVIALSKELLAAIPALGIPGDPDTFGYTAEYRDDASMNISPGGPSVHHPYGVRNGVHIGLGAHTSSKARALIGFGEMHVYDGEGSYTMHYGVLVVPDDQSLNPVTYTPLQEIVTPEVGAHAVDVVFPKDPINAIFGPDFPGATYLVGPLPKAGIALAAHELAGASCRKAGFAEYINPSTPPKFYRRETASGGFPGCGLSTPPQSAKNYSGDQLVEYQSIEPGNPLVNWSFRSTFSADVKAALAGVMLGCSSPLFPFFGQYTPAGSDPVRGDDLLDEEDAAEYNAPSLPAEDVTRTTRTFRRRLQCGPTPIQDALTMTLSDEITTAEMIAYVEAAVALDYGVMSTPDFSEGAVTHLSPDETYYVKQKFRFKITGTIPVVYDEERTFTFVYTLLTFPLDGGDPSSSDQSVDLIFPAGSTVQTSDWIEVEAAPSTHVKLKLDPDKQPSEPIFALGNPWPVLIPNREPVLIDRTYYP